MLSPDTHFNKHRESLSARFLAVVAPNPYPRAVQKMPGMLGAYTGAKPKHKDDVALSFSPQDETEVLASGEHVSLSPEALEMLLPDCNLEPLLSAWG